MKKNDVQIGQTYAVKVSGQIRPVKLTAISGETSTLVDGGVLSNFPIDTFDRPDGKQSPRLIGQTTSATRRRIGDDDHATN